MLGALINGEANRDEAFGGREIVYEDLGYLPLTLPYSITDQLDSFDDIPLDLTDSISFSLFGNSASNLNFIESQSINTVLYTPNIYGKRVVLAYAPATSADAAVLEQYGGLFNTPAYLLKLKPQLIIDGQVVSEGALCNAGYLQKYKINIHNASNNNNDSSVENSIVAGGIYCIALDYGTISVNGLQRSYDQMEALKQVVSEANIYTDMAMGEMLDTVAKAYFSQLDSYNAIMSGQYNVVAARDMSVGIVGFKVNVVYTFNRPSELNEGGIFLDIGHDAHSVVSLENNSDDEKTFMLQAGIYASAMEHGVLEQATGVESVSTIKAFEYAVNNDIPIHVISKENLATELDAINVSEQIENDIRSSVNSGRIVIIPEEEITINQWSGAGYMILDPDTCACGYMISGGLSGGSMTVGQMICEYIFTVLQGAYEMVKWLVLTTTMLAVCPCGWVGFIGVAIKITELILLTCAVVEMYNLYRMYEATGNIYYLQELGIQVAAFATLSIASKLLGNKINKLKEAVTDAINKTGLGGKCFVAGTLVFTTMGLTPIENITSDTMVYSFNPNTLEISEKQVEDVFVKQSSKLIDIEVNGDIIRTTLDHPFYVPKKGFTRAVDLKAGDELFTLNGEYVVIEKIQHVILEAPVNVYNFSVADFHTYFVSESQVAVHNSRCPTSANFDPGTGSKYGHSISEHGKQNGSSLADRARTGYEQHLAFENGTRTESPSVSPDQGHWLHNGKAAQVMDNAMSNPNVPKTGVYEVSIPEGIGEVIACENGVIKTYPATKARVVFNGDGTVKTAFPIR